MIHHDDFTTIKDPSFMIVKPLTPLKFHAYTVNPRGKMSGKD